jgi:antitoxin VapB
MPIRIASPVVVAKLERLAAATGLTRTAAVERAVDVMLTNRANASDDDFETRASAILAQSDRIRTAPMRLSQSDGMSTVYRDDRGRYVGPCGNWPG